VVRGIAVASIVLIALVIALISTSYPSLVVSNTTTQAFPGFETYTSQYQVSYPQPIASTGLSGYSTFTAWYPGNPICDPASNACTPFPTPIATLVYPQSVTYAYQVTLTSQATLAYTSGFMSFSTQTSYQNIPPYAALGLTEFQFGIIALGIMMVVLLGLLLIFTRKSSASQVRSSSAEAARFCEQCGAANAIDSIFCSNCGARLEQPP